MDDSASQADEGYSEAPLNQLSVPTQFPLKPHNDNTTFRGLNLGSNGPLPEWLTQQISSLSLSGKTELAMALLNDLPTSVISQIVQQLNSRLYIDFINYLPPEVCLKILGYLDPVSLIHLAMSCRACYDIALDRKLWENLYYKEGWIALPKEIEAAETAVNAGPIARPQRTQSDEDGHAHKKRAISMSPSVVNDTDLPMLDIDGTIRQEPRQMELDSSIFGGPAAQTSISQRLGNLDMRSSESGSGSKASQNQLASSGMRFELSPVNSADDETNKSSLPKSAMWTWDGLNNRHRINWRYLYTMRRRLESNWEQGKYTNFQLPHPDHPDEAHGECIYSLQYNSKYLVSGSRDCTLKIWNLKTRRLIRTLAKHRGSVLCLQFDSDPEEDLIVSGSSDSDVIIWKFSTGQEVQVLKNAHRESVLNVRFDKRILVTCSKDKTIKIFNRRELKYGDLGYQEVDPVPRIVNFSPDDLPRTPAWTQIGCLEGHSAAVNAVQILGREVVSASGDKHIKIWDWPSQVCTRTILAHTKGIACVQYDGRRIVSGSSDNEVRVFDRHTGLEVASLRSHVALVRTVQVGFADLPYSAEDDAEEAKKVDAEYFKALEEGRLEGMNEFRRGNRRQGNAGSKRPEDITAYGAKVPPGGGGGKYGRIVSGSYDTSIIIWRRDKDGVWDAQHHLTIEKAAHAAMREGRSPQRAGAIPLHPSVQQGVRQALPGTPRNNAGPSTTTPAAPAAGPSNPAPRTQSASAPPAPGRPTLPPTNASRAEAAMQANLSPTSIQSYQQMIDLAVPAGPQALSEALASYPAMLTQRPHLQAAIEREPSPFVRSQLRQAVNTAIFRAEFEQARQRREAAGAAAAQSQPAPRAPGATTAAAPPRAGVAGSSAAAQPTMAPAQAQVAAVTAARHHVHVQGGVRLYQVPPTAPTVNAPVTSPVAAAASSSLTLPPILAPPHTPHPPQAALASISNVAAPAPAPAPAHHHHHHPHHHHQDAGTNAARVFKLQFDARRIICCSQTSVIVGWDFCNGDPELEEASRFFGAVQ